MDTAIDEKQITEKMVTAIGIHTAYTTMRIIVDNLDIQETEKKSAFDLIDRISPAYSIGCMKIDFYNLHKSNNDTAYLLLDICPKDHNLDTQLVKLKSIIDPLKWPAIVKSLSTLIMIGRIVYNRVLTENIDKFDPVLRLSDEHRELFVDVSNTTLYIKEEWKERIGIFIHLSNENSDTPI